MIASPCLNCPKKNGPKDLCLKDCRILHAVQDYYFSIPRVSLSTAIDYTAENRYSILLDGRLFSPAD